MNERTSTGVNPPAPPQPRIWAFTMDGYLPPAEAVDADAAPTAADLAADRLLARLDGLRQQLAARLPFAAQRTRREKHERVAR